MRILILILSLALTSGCEHLPTSKTSNVLTADSSRNGSSITRDEVMQIARGYAEHEWRAGEANTFHGLDNAGVRIDTPDRTWWGSGGWRTDGHINRGIPYCWGGDSTLAEFDAGIESGRPAGYHFKGVNRKTDGDPSESDLPVGVDCSGLVSRCWCLKMRRSTYNMSDVSHPLPSFDDLRSGDAVNKPHNHIILFVKWLDQKHENMQVFEAGDAKKNDDPKDHERVHLNTYERSWLIEKGFVPLRYVNIAE
ncbi:MAG TPA: hypothetical protein VGO57_02965, partial [Verrucomicrobiae bacterium]